MPEEQELSPVPDGYSFLTDPGGQTVAVHQSEVAARKAQGYSPASTEAVTAFRRKDAQLKKYGTAGQTAIAGLEGAGRGLTFGLSTGAERLLGVDPEGIAARQEASPIASGVGEAAGVLAPAVLSAGASLLPEAGASAVRGAAELAGPSLVSRLGGAVAESVGESLPGNVGRAYEAQQAARATIAAKAAGIPFVNAAPALAQGTGRAARIAADLIPRGAGSAVEGAAYGAGQWVHEKMLGDPNATAENLLATAGPTALFMGSLGAGGGLLNSISREASVGELGEKLRGWLSKSEGMSSIKELNPTQSTIQREANKYGEGKAARQKLYKIASEFRDYGILNGIYTSNDQALDRAGVLASEGGKQMEDALTSAMNTGRVKPRNISDLLDTFQDKGIDPVEANPHTAGAVKALRDLKDNYLLQYGNNPLSLHDLQEIRSQIGSDVYQKSLDPYAKPYGQAISVFRRIVGDEIKTGLNEAGTGIEDWTAGNRKVQVAKTAKTFAQKGAIREEGNNRISPTEALGVAGGFSHAGIPGALEAGLGAALIRRLGPGVLGWAARGARGALENEEAEALGLLRGGGPVTAATPIPGAPPVGPTPGAPAGGGPAAAGPLPIGGTIPPLGQTATHILTPQVPGGEAAHYALVEADDLLASHNHDTFARNRSYPSNVQEREYGEPLEKRKVTLGGQGLDPRLVLSDTPSAVDGPPIVTGGDQSIVLGGNGRSMMLRRAYDEGAPGEAYRKALIDRAPRFGLSPEEAGQMKQPVIVRVLDGIEDNADSSKLRGAVRRFNESLTQELSPRLRAVSDGRLLSDTTMQQVGELFAGSEGASLRDLFKSDPEAFESVLIRDGLITPQNRPTWIAGGQLTDEAKDRIEGMFLGRVIGSAGRLAATPPSILNKVERLVPSLVRVESVNPEFGEVQTIQSALDLLSDAARRKVPLKDVLSQRSLFTDGRPVDPHTAAMAQLLEKSNAKDLAAKFKTWSQDAAFDPKQVQMFGAPPAREDVVKSLFEGSGIDPGAPLPNEPITPETSAVAPLERPEQSPEQVQALAAMERANNEINRKIEQRTSWLLGDKDRLKSVGRSEIALGLSKFFGKPTSEQRKDFDKQAQQLSSLAHDPNVQQKFLENQSADMYEHAPAITQASQLLLTKAVTFLASKLPSVPISGPLAPKYTPSDAEIAKFYRSADAVNQPLSILKQAAAGVLTPEAVEAVATVYPDLLDRVRKGLVAGMIKHPNPGQSTRQMLSLIMGEDLDGTQGASLTGAIQSVYQPVQQPPSVPGKPGGGGTAKGLAHFDTKRFRTQVQAASAERED